MEGFIVNVIVEFFTRVDKIAETKQLCGVFDFQRIRYRVAHVEFDGLVGCVIVNGLRKNHTQFLNLGRTSIILTIIIFENDGIAATFETPRYIGITTADGEIGIYTLG